MPSWRMHARECLIKHVLRGRSSLRFSSIHISHSSMHIHTYAQLNWNNAHKCIINLVLHRSSSLRFSSIYINIQAHTHACSAKLNLRTWMHHQSCAPSQLIPALFIRNDVWHCSMVCFNSVALLWLHVCMRMYICMYVYMYLCKEWHITMQHGLLQLCRSSLDACMYVYMYACMYMWMYVCVCLCMHVDMHVYTCVYVWPYVYTYKHTKGLVYLKICIYIYIHTHKYIGTKV
jgi:hypothetical protein